MLSLDRNHIDIIPASLADFFTIVVQAEGILLQQSQKSRHSARKEAGQPSGVEAVGADNAGQAVMLKPHTRKRQAQSESPSSEAALDTQADQAVAEVGEARMQEGQEDQDGELTLEQRVNALNLHQQPAGASSFAKSGPNVRTRGIWFVT